MTKFERWFRSAWMQAGENLTTAVARLHVASGVSHGTIYKALKGRPLRADVAMAIEQFSGGKISKEHLAFPEGARPRAA